MAGRQRRVRGGFLVQIGNTQQYSCILAAMRRMEARCQQAEYTGGGGSRVEPTMGRKLFFWDSLGQYVESIDDRANVRLFAWRATLRSLTWAASPNSALTELADSAGSISRKSLKKKSIVHELS
jgi:hypothetical protein